MSWVQACATDDVEPEDVTPFPHAAPSCAGNRREPGAWYATDGLCTHEAVHLADGLVMGDIIECPKHNGRFDYRSGEPKGAPVCVALRTYPVRVEGDAVLIDIG